MDVADVLFRDDPPDLQTLIARAPDVSQLAIFGLAVSAWRVLERECAIAGEYLGRSLGEIAALVCAGGFSVAEGVEIICHRMAALRSVGDEPGAMAALAIDRQGAAQLVAEIGADRVAIAVENTRSQFVLAGTRAGIAALQAAAGRRNIVFRRLSSPYGFHFAPLMARVREAFLSRIRGLTARPLARLVYSPILGRHYQPTASLVERLADHFILPVRFADAVERLHEDGAKTYVECGGLDTLTKLVKSILHDPRVPAFSTFSQHTSASNSMTNIIRYLRDGAGDQRAPPNPSDTAFATRERLLAEVVAMFAQALEYPESVFHENVDLEAELGIDSVKQMELLGKLGTRYGIGAPPDGFKLTDYRTLDRVVDYVESALRTSPTAPVTRPNIVSASVETPVAGRPDAIRADRAALLAEVVTLFAQALEYPESVFHENVDLEAELGIDSVKQMELLGKLGARYGIGAPPEDFRLADYRTLGRVVDYVENAFPAVSTTDAATTAAPAPAADLVAESAPLPWVDRVTLLAEIVAMFAQALEYPQSVFHENVDLEAELGIDSVKQMELLGKLGTLYGIEAPSEGFQLSEYRTLVRIVDYVAEALGSNAVAQSQAPSVTQVEPAPATPPTPAMPAEPIATAGQRDLEGKVALVTGGGKGVGKVLSRKLAARGAQVIVNYFHSQTEARATIEEITAAGGMAEALRASVARKEQVERMFQEIEKRFGRLDILINNAAAGAMVPMADVTDEYFDRALDTNVKGAFWCCREAARIMSKSSGGTIVNISSLGAQHPVANYLVVGTSKAGVETLTRYLAAEYAALGIRVNCASAGMLDTDVIRSFPDYEEMRRGIEQLTPLGRIGTPEDLADVVLFLVSSESRWITGQTIVADGGLSIARARPSADEPDPDHPPPGRGAPSRDAGAPRSKAHAQTAGTSPTPPSRDPPIRAEKTVVAAAAEPPAERARPIASGPRSVASATEDIAIVGMGLVLPGTNNPDEYWRLLMDGENRFERVPSDRWHVESFLADDPVDQDKGYCSVSAFIGQLAAEPLSPSLLIIRCSGCATLLSRRSMESPSAAPAVPRSSSATHPMGARHSKNRCSSPE